MVFFFSRKLVLKITWFVYENWNVFIFRFSKSQTRFFFIKTEQFARELFACRLLSRIWLLQRTCTSFYTRPRVNFMCSTVTHTHVHIHTMHIAIALNEFNTHTHRRQTWLCDDEQAKRRRRWKWTTTQHAHKNTQTHLQTCAHAQHSTTEHRAQHTRTQRVEMK